MIRHVLIFVIAAGIGALIALALRSAWHQPYTAPAEAPAQQMPAPAKPANDPHAGHAAVTPAKPVNTICAICGMDVDPKLTAIYQDKVIGFGCAKCLPKFAKDPERFGPYFLKNQEAP